MSKLRSAIAIVAIAAAVPVPASAQNNGAPPPPTEEQQDPAAKAREEALKKRDEAIRQRQEQQQQHQQQIQQQQQQRQQQIQEQKQLRQQQIQDRQKALQEQRAKANAQRESEIQQRQKALEQQRQLQQQQQLEAQLDEREKERRANEKAREERLLKKKLEIEAEQAKQRQEQDERLKAIQDRQDKARAERDKALKTPPPAVPSTQRGGNEPWIKDKGDSWVKTPPPSPGTPAGNAVAPRPVETREQIDARRQAIEVNRARIVADRDRLRQQRMETRNARIEQFRQQRRERVEAQGQRTVIEEPGRRFILREGNRSFIQQDETLRFRQTYRDRDTRTERRQDGTRITIITQPNRVQIVTVQDAYGRLIRRYRRFPDGREFTLIDNRRLYWDTRFGRPRPRYRDRSFLNFVINLPPPVLSIPSDRYIVDYDDASEDDVYEALSAPPVDRLDRGYSYDEVRSSRSLRDRMRRVDLDNVTFETGSWYVGIAQIPKLERVARAMLRLIEKNPDEVFLIEGHTDAVGSDIDNLSLSDRRAESVAVILTQEFGVPAENLTTQGYGEEFLKVQTDGPERLNRRTAVRRITPLLARSDSGDDHYWREEPEQSRYDDRSGDDGYRDDGEDDRYRDDR